MLCFVVFIVFNVISSTIENSLEGVTFANVFLRSKYPSFGRCWTSAMRSLKTGCDNLSLESQKYMALKFTDCFLVMSGGNAYGCDGLAIGEKRNGCIKKMPTKDYNTFTDFFTHVNNLCNFLEIQVWQEDTEAKFMSLLAISSKAKRMLKEALKKQNISLQLQKMSSSEQMQIIKSTDRLDERFFELQSKTERTVDNLSRSTSGSYGTLMETFAGLSALQQWLANKTAWLETLIFYVCGVVVILLLTLLPELKEAKWILFLLVMAAACVECGVWSLSLNHDVWFARNVLVYMCTGLLCFSAYYYRDTESANNSIVVEIERNIDLLEELLHGTRLSNGNSHFVQNAQVASSDNRVSVTPDKTTVSTFNCDTMCEAIMPDRMAVNLQKDVKRIWSCVRHSVTPDRASMDVDTLQCKKAPKLRQSPSTNEHRPMELLHRTLGTGYTGSQSAV